jgi:hypothetical protein
MNLTTARSYIAQWLRGESGVAFNAAEYDRALLTQGDDFIRRARFGVQVSNLTISDSTEALPAFPTGFRPDRFLSAWLIDASSVPVRQLSLISQLELRERQYQHGISDSIPEYLAFLTNTTGELYPVPDQAYTLKLEWLPFFDSWTEGIAQTTAVLSGSGLASITVNHGGYYASTPAVTFSGGGGSGAAATAVLTDNVLTSFTSITAGTGYTSAPTVLLDGVATSTVTLSAIPDDILRPILIYGCGALLQANMPQEPYAALSLKKYEELIQRCSGMFGAQATAVFSRIDRRTRQMKRVDFALE